MQQLSAPIRGFLTNSLGGEGAGTDHLQPTPPPVREIHLERSQERERRVRQMNRRIRVELPQTEARGGAGGAKTLLGLPFRVCKDSPGPGGPVRRAPNGRHVVPHRQQKPVPGRERNVEKNRQCAPPPSHYRVRPGLIFVLYRVHKLERFFVFRGE